MGSVGQAEFFSRSIFSKFTNLLIILTLTKGKAVSNRTNVYARIILVGSFEHLLRSLVKVILVQVYVTNSQSKKLS